MNWTLKSDKEPPIREEKLWVTNLGAMLLATRNAETGNIRYTVNTEFILGREYDECVDADEQVDYGIYKRKCAEYLYAWMDKPELPQLPELPKIEETKGTKETEPRMIEFRYQPRYALKFLCNPDVPNT